jgi:PAS domain S-box-containing protein
MRFWPRTVRWQLILGLMLLQALSVGLFVVLLVNRQGQIVREQLLQRLAHEATSVAMQTQEALQHQRPDWVTTSLKMMDEAPSVELAKVTDGSGKVLFSSQGNPAELRLTSEELAEIPMISGDQPHVFKFGGQRWEGVKAIYSGPTLMGYAWVEADRTWDSEQLITVLQSTLSFGMIWAGASALLVLLMSRSISKPLGILQGGTRALMEGPEGGSRFPLPVTVDNEFGDLIGAFNRMVASIEEQRSGLHDTLSLLDSMLANAPIGLVFFDRRCKIVRVNGVFAAMTGVPLSRHLGRTLPELLPKPVAEKLEQAVLRVIALEAPVHDVELTGQAGKLNWPWTWLVTAYPVRTIPDQVRWVGAIVIDVSERKRSEEALRRTEKLAATGRLAASIAHEINNPLEAITNLLFLLREYGHLEKQALNYVNIAEHEVQRMSEITQQTLRFYRQSTSPARANMAELLDSVLTLYSGRLNTLGIQLERRYDSTMDLYCFAGEVRQVIANLVSNAIDASVGGGRLVVCARRSREWSGSNREGVRFTVADTGGGMEDEVRRRLFEAFFTTKGATGTGLGLWVSHEIIQKHQGRVHVRSRVANGSGPSGSVFQMFFPDNQELTMTTN